MENLEKLTDSEIEEIAGGKFDKVFLASALASISALANVHGATQTPKDFSNAISTPTIVEQRITEENTKAYKDFSEIHNDDKIEEIEKVFDDAQNLKNKLNKSENLNKEALELKKEAEAILEKAEKMYKNFLNNLISDETIEKAYEGFVRDLKREEKNNFKGLEEEDIEYFKKVLNPKFKQEIIVNIVSGYKKSINPKYKSLTFYRESRKDLFKFSNSSDEIKVIYEKSVKAVQKLERAVEIAIK